MCKISQNYRFKVLTQQAKGAGALVAYCFGVLGKALDLVIILLV